MNSCPILDRLKTTTLFSTELHSTIQSVKKEIKVITTTRVFCSFNQANIRDYPNSGQSDLQPYTLVGPWAHDPKPDLNPNPNPNPNTKLGRSVVVRLLHEQVGLNPSPSPNTDPDPQA